MARKPTRQSGPTRKAAAASETSESIAEQTAAFLKSGNRVEVLDSDISKLPKLGAESGGNPHQTR